MQILNKAGFDNDIVTYVASVVVKNIDVKNGKQHEELRRNIYQD